MTLSAQGGAAILKRVAPGIPGTTAMAACFAVAALLTIVIGVYGHALIMAVQRYLTYAFIVLTVVYMILMAPKLGTSLDTTAGPGGWVGGVIFAMTLLGLGWVNCGADYSRYLPRSRPSSGGHVDDSAAAAPPMLLLVFGVLLAGGDPQLAQAAAADPVGALAGALPTWFLLPYLLTAIGGFLAGADHGHLLVGAVHAGAGRADQAALRGAYRRRADGARRLLSAVRLGPASWPPSRRSWRSSGW